MAKSKPTGSTSSGTWLDGYQNPADSTLLYTFVLKTAQAEWHRLRVQREYDFHMFGHGSPPIAAWQPHGSKNHDLILRYLMRRKPLQPAGTESTAAERRFQREYRLLEHHWKSHEAQASPTGRNGNHEAPASPTGSYGNHEAPASPTGSYGNHEAPASPTGSYGNHEAPASPTGSHGNHEGP
jgi:hypothetical protein